jgi:hypothetical protein
MRRFLLQVKKGFHEAKAKELAKQLATEQKIRTRLTELSATIDAIEKDEIPPTSETIAALRSQLENCLAERKSTGWLGLLFLLDLHLPPGSHLWKFAEFFCTKKTYDSVFHPLLADFQHEYFEALKDGRVWKARWTRVLYLGAFFKSAGLNVAMRFLREAWDRFKKVTP